MIKHCYFSCGCQPDKMASKTIIIIIIFYIYRCTCTFSFVVTEAELAIAAVLFDEASWAANMESGSRPSKVSALAWIKLSGSAANDALDVLGDAAFNFLSGLSILCKKKRNIWINFVVAHIQSSHKSFFVVLIFKALKKRNYMKKQFKIRSIRPAKQISQLRFCWREKPNCTIKYNLAIEWRMENYIAILRNESCIKRRETQQRNYLRQLKLL